MSIAYPTILEINSPRARQDALHNISKNFRWGGPRVEHTDHIRVTAEAFDALQKAYSEKRRMSLAITLDRFVVMPSDGILKIDATRKRTLLHKDPRIKPRSFQKTEELIEVYHPTRVAYGTISDLEDKEWNTVFGFTNLRKYLQAYDQIPSGNYDPKRRWFTAFSME